MHAPRSKIARIELNSTTEKNFTSCPAELYALRLCECVCVCIVCRVWVCVLLYRCVCFGFFSVFFRISCDFLAFIVLATKKSGKRQSQPELSTMAIGIFVGPKQSSGNERVIDTIINKYRERRRKPAQRSVSQCISLSIDVVTCWNTQTRASCPISAYRL